MSVRLILALIFTLSSCFIDAFQCPAIVGLFANPNSEHSFYHCAHGIPYLKLCPIGLIWNQKIQVCDWPIPKPTNDCDNENLRNCRETSRWSIDGITIAGSNNQFGSDAQHLGSPFGLFIDRKHGNSIYVADTDNHRIQKFNRTLMNGIGLTVAGGNGAGNGSHQLNMPRAIYVDRNENIYIADDNNNRIQLWKKNAIVGITVAGGNGKGKGLNQIGACHGIFVDEDSNTLFISDFYNDRVVQWISEKNEGKIVAGNGISGSNASQLSMPRGIFVDQCHSIYVADMWNNRIQKWKKDAHEGITVAGGNGKGSGDHQLNQPWSVVVDQYNNLYIADTDNHRIQKWVVNATTGTTIAGGNGYGDKPNQFKYPYGVAIDQDGDLFVSEQRNHRIQRFNIQPETNIC